MPPRVAVSEAEFTVGFASRAAAFAAAFLAVTLPMPVARALQPSDRVTICEVHYDPTETPESSFEFIEIANVGTTTVFLDGAVITDEGNDGGAEATFQFPGIPLTGTTLPLVPGGILLLVADAEGCPYAGVDFEFYAGSSDSDDPAVPNLVKTSGLAADLYLANTGDGITLSVGITSGNIIPCGEIVDGVSWETGGAPDVTATSATTCSDPAPHPEIDNSSNSMQRCPESTDTNQSAIDFVAARRTPGAPNVCTASEPVIENVDTSPCVPASGQPVLVSCVASDADGDLESATVFFRRAGVTPFDSLTLTPVVVGLYQAQLPGQLDQTVVEYFVRVRDVIGYSTNFPAGAPAAVARYRVGITPISTVQSSVMADSCASSAFAGKPVHVVGVVTHHALEFSASYFYLQNGVGPFAGIRIAVPDGSYVPEIGDSLLVSGDVEESNCQTQVVLDGDCVQLRGVNRRVRARVLNTIGAIAQESNEGMLVRVSGTLDVLTAFDSIPGSPWAGREFLVGDGSGLVWIGDDTFTPDGIGYWYTPVPRHSLESVTGIVAARWPSSYDPVTRLRLEPRRDPDVDLLLTDAPIARPPGARLALEPNVPNPFNPSTSIGFVVPGACRIVLTVHDARGRRVRSLLERDYDAPSRDSVVWDGRDDAGHALPSGVYWVSLRNALDGTQSFARKMLLAR